MEQLKKEIIKHKPSLKKYIQLIGDNNKLNENKLITICVFNSVHLIENYMDFEKVFIDEAHHIDRPAIYYENDESVNTEDINDEDFTDNDYEDELVNVKKYSPLDVYVPERNYSEIIKNLTQYNNNVYLSATIDPINNFEYYSKDIRTMIDLKYLCDYQIHVPIFSDDPTNKNICIHLLNSYRNIIIYCNSQKEGKLINKILNGLQNNSSEYIDCNTNKKKRNDIIDKYKNGVIPFLVNVRILVEGFDAPITKGVCFLHLPHSQTTLIQIIGRCLRLHPTKNIANIILPFSSSEDEKNICNFLNIMAKNDSRIRKSYKSKKLGGYISIDKFEETNNEIIKLKYEMVYNSMGIIINGTEIWYNKLEQVKIYIDENNKKPSTYCKSSEDTKSLGKWIYRQNKNYKIKMYNMKDNKIYEEWTRFINNPKYKEYFLTDEGENITNGDRWMKKLYLVKEYIDKNNKRPSNNHENQNIKQLGVWIGVQHTQYSNKEFIMKNNEIYDEWTKFLKEYDKHFNNKKWHETLEILEKYINDNKKRPYHLSKDINIKKLAKWMSNQQQFYIKKEKIMNNEEFYNKWTKFINDYEKYFNNNTKWINTLEQVKNYIDKHNERPSQYDKNIIIKSLGSWILTQLKNYIKKNAIMKDIDIYNRWNDFINDSKYEEYF